MTRPDRDSQVDKEGRKIPRAKADADRVSRFEGRSSVPDASHVIEHIHSDIALPDEVEAWLLIVIEVGPQVASERTDGHRRVRHPITAKRRDVKLVPAS